MTTYQRKSISLATYNPLGIDQNFGYVFTDWSATNTGWLRLTVPWDKIAPYGPNNPATDPSPLPGGPAGFTVANYVAALDAQIGLANQLGVGVILVFDAFPQWANGINDHLQPPSDTSVGSDWWYYLGWIIQRWSILTPPVPPATSHPYATVVEVCNEPNQAWNGLTAAQKTITVGRMMNAGQSFVSAGYFTPLLGAPALADRVDGTADDSVSFTNALLGYLSTNGFPAFGSSSAGSWIWTQHNYGDLEHGTANGWERAQAIRSRLKAYGWRAWPSGDPTQPYVFITEGGVRVGSSPYGGSASSRAARTGVVYNHVHNDSVAGGEGLAMVTNFLDISITNPAGDCGLRESFSPYNPRPVYATWAGLTAP